MTIAKLLALTLKRAGADTVFGIPSYVGLGILQALHETKFKIELNSHEQNAAHMAEGYYYATGKLPIVSLAIGPGVTNALTGIANAYCESIPMIILAARASGVFIGRNEYHANSGIGRSLDEKKLLDSCTKQAYYLDNPTHAPRLIRDAVKTALTGRPGPVYISIPPQIQKIEVEEPSWLTEKRLFQLNSKPTNKDQLQKYKALFEEAKKPIIILGSEIKHAYKTDLEVFLRDNCPYFTSYGAKGKVPVLPNYLGTCWYSNSQGITKAIAESDLVVAMGEHFTHFTVRAFLKILETKPLIQISEYSEEIGRCTPPALGIENSIDEFLATSDSTKKPWQPLNIPNRKAGKEFNTLNVIRSLGQLAPSNAVFAGDVGNAGYASVTDLVLKDNQEFYTSGKFGVCGFSTAAAIGYSYGDVTKPVFSIVGDLSFAMNMQEVMNVKKFKSNTTFLVFNNSSLQNIVQDQCDMVGHSIQADIEPVNYRALAQAFDVDFHAIKTFDELSTLFEKVNFNSDSRIVEILVDKDDRPLA